MLGKCPVKRVSNIIHSSGIGSDTSLIRFPVPCALMALEKLPLVDSMPLRNFTEAAALLQLLARIGSCGVKKTILHRGATHVCRQKRLGYEVRHTFDDYRSPDLSRRGDDRNCIIEAEWACEDRKPGEDA